jgi:hypothetical protein
MAGRVVVSTLNDDTGVLATQNGMSGIAKAWVQWVPSTGVINAQLNVSSVTTLATGRFRINFTTSMPSANYSVMCLGAVDNINGNLDNGSRIGISQSNGVITFPTASNVTIQTMASGGGLSNGAGWFALTVDSL